VASRIIQLIESIASELPRGDRNLALYFPDLDTPPPAGSVNRVFGPPLGITDMQWPLYPRLAELLAEANALSDWCPGDLRMEHVFTIDLRDIRLPGAPEGAQAMMLFLSNASWHRATHRGNGDTAVLFLGEDELARGPRPGPLPSRSLRRWSRRFTLRRIDVPGDVFDPHEDETSPLARLHDAIWQAPARLGGCPIWVRDPDETAPAPSEVASMAPRAMGSATDTFLMQFERRFADVNLGPHGVMYVTGTGAHAQWFDEAQFLDCSAASGWPSGRNSSMAW
jgi:hypothetical protein